MHDLMTSTTGEIQLELLQRAIVRRTNQIVDLESQLAGLRLKQESRMRERIVIAERARQERAAADAKLNAMTTET